MAMQLGIELGFFLWAPLIIALLIGLPAWICQCVFSDSSFKLRMTFLFLNLLGLILVLLGSYAHCQMMITTNVSFDWHSFFKIALILGTPVLVNMLMMVFLSLPFKNTPSASNARRYSSRPNHLAASE